MSNTIRKINNLPETVWVGEGITFAVSAEKKTITLTVDPPSSYTVATLPAEPNTGDKAIVTDATAPAWNTAVVGGGAVVVNVYYNGTTWIAH